MDRPTSSNITYRSIGP